jgi:hypothetical protein
MGNGQNEVVFAALMRARRRRRGGGTLRRDAASWTALHTREVAAAPARGHVGLLAGRSDSLGVVHGSPSVRSHLRRGWVHSGVAQTSVRRRIDTTTRGRRIRNARARTRAR